MQKLTKMPNKNQSKNKTDKRSKALNCLKNSILISFGLTLFNLGYADESSMNATLVQAVEQLQQITPLIQQAINQEPDNLKPSIHLSAFTDANGNLQNGALEDLQALQSGLIAIINRNQIDPKYYAPITGDYLGSTP